MSAITPVVQAARHAASEVAHRAAPSLAHQAEAATERAFAADARVVGRRASKVAPAEGTSLVRRLLVAAGWLKPTAEESKPIINQLLHARSAGVGPVNQPYSPNYSLRVKPLRDGTYAFASRAERWDPTVPYASEQRPLTLLGVFDPEQRKLTSLKTINRTPQKWETYERIFMEPSRRGSLLDCLIPPPMRL
ncbi:MAG: hypothetical protein VKS61_13915 [Candidatus Sericytochromatia bacterium]|nr:hypothetical protein [Candidatus Sericytochromatia bacterium]